MNKKHFLLIAITALAFTLGGCLKSDSSSVNNCVSNTSGVPTAAELSALQSYLTSNSISATQDPGGFFYMIHTQGTGAYPIQSSKITVKYTGKLTDGSVFASDLTGNALFNLSDLILGWRRGLPLIQKGGSITLYIPPSLGYDCATKPGIPSRSNLIFDIELLNVQ